MDTGGVAVAVNPGAWGTGGSVALDSGADVPVIVNSGVDVPSRPVTVSVEVADPIGPSPVAIGFG
jgi:hypothetical protein